MAFPRNLLPRALGIAAGLLAVLTVAEHAHGQCVGHEDWKVLATDGSADDRFGSAIARDGDFAVFGAALDDDIATNAGSAYVYNYQNPGPWIEIQKLLPSSGQGGDLFGSSADVDGNVIVVGAPYDDEGGTNAGAAYVFHFNGTQFVEQQKLIAPDADADDFMGEAVAVDGNWVIVGGSDDDDGINAGSAYAWRWNGSQWVLAQKLTSSTAADSDHYGRSLSVQGDRLLVGCANDDTAGTDVGAVYFYGFNGSTWIERQVVTTTFPGVEERFGFSVSLDGDAFVGGTFDGNRAVVFRWDGSSWNEEASLVGSDITGSDRYGIRAAISGDLVVVGAGIHDPDGITNAGAAYTFRHDGNQWLELQKYVASTLTEDDEFGTNVAVDGDLCMVNAADAPDNNGAVYSFVAPDTALDAQPATVDLGDPVTLANCGGSPNAPAAMFTASVDGVHFVMRLFIGAFDGAGSWDIAGNIPNDPNLSGHSIGFWTFSISARGPIVVSNVEELTIQ